MRGLTTAERLRTFLRALGTRSTRPAGVYLVGGASAVWEGWRESTVDIDLKLVPDHDELYRAIRDLKDELNLNVELASPDLFIPVAAGWEHRSPHLDTFGTLSVGHFDFVAQALAKLERGHDHDLRDVRSMITRGLVAPIELRETYSTIEPELYRFPALDATTFRTAVETFLDARDRTRDDG